MRTLRGVLLALLLLMSAGAGRSDEADVVKVVIDKGIKALGGEEKLTALQGISMAGKGFFHSEGQKLPFTGVWRLQGPTQYRGDITEERGSKRTEIRVVSGDKGWVKRGNDEARAFSADELAEERETLWFNHVSSLVPLRGKEVKLTPLGEVKVEGKPAVGVKVASKGHRDIKLFFDKETGLLVKGERPVKDVDRNKEYTEEVIFSDYQDAGGVKLAMKYVTRWDGKVLAEVEMTEARAEEKLADRYFMKP